MGRVELDGGAQAGRVRAGRRRAASTAARQVLGEPEAVGVAHEADDLVALGQQQLGQEGAVLAGDAGDKRPPACRWSCRVARRHGRQSLAPASGAAASRVASSVSAQALARVPCAPSSRAPPGRASRRGSCAGPRRCGPGRAATRKPRSPASSSSTATRSSTETSRPVPMLTSPLTPARRDRGEVRRHDVADVDVVARLASVAEHGRRLAGEQLAAEDRHDAGLAERVLPGAVDVAVAQRDRRRRRTAARTAARSARRRTCSGRTGPRAAASASRGSAAVGLAVDRAAGGAEDEAPDARLVRGLQHVDRALDVDAARRRPGRRPTCARRSGPRGGRRPRDGNAAAVADTSAASVMSTSRSAAPRANAPSRFERRPVDRLSITCHVVAGIEQRVDEIGADEPGSAGDEGAHRGHPSGASPAVRSLRARAAHRRTPRASAALTTSGAGERPHALAPALAGLLVAPQARYRQRHRCRRRRRHE